jgi:hypothetical protein
MTVIAPMMKTEKDRTVRVQNLIEGRISGMVIGGVEQGLIPFGTDLHIRNCDNWPSSFHSGASGPNEKKMSYRLPAGATAARWVCGEQPA